MSDEPEHRESPTLQPMDMPDPSDAPAPGDQSAAVEAGAHASLSLLDAPATYTLLFINLLWFAAMFHSGPYMRDWQQHKYLQILTDGFVPEALKYFGGCDTYLVVGGGQWIRLVTAAFIHLNPLHLLVNMWCLWNLGLLGEPLLGKRGLFAVYILTGIAGNMCSIIFNLHQGHNGLVVGASGAVFGIAGILIVLLSNRKLSLPWEELRALRRSVVQFAVLNLLIGMTPTIIMALVPARVLGRSAEALIPLTHIDNMAHLGGLLCGLIMGMPLFPRMLVGRTGYRERQRVTFAGTAFALMLIAYGISKAAETPKRPAASVLTQPR